MIKSSMIQNKRYKHELNLRNKYNRMIDKNLEDIKKCPLEDIRNFETTLRKIKERAAQRTISMLSEIKQTSEWTMNKLVKNVIESKKRKREEERKRKELIQEEMELRQQLETQSFVSNLGMFVLQKSFSILKKSKPNIFKKLASLHNLSNRRKSFMP